MKEKKNVPKLRFPGFTEKWEQRKLGDIALKVTEKNGSLEFDETLTNSAEYGIINQREFFDKDISNKDNINGYYIVKEEDFVYNPRISATAPVGPINRNKLGRTGIMSPLYTVFRTHDIENGFLEWFFKSDHWHSYMYFNGDTGARSDRFSIKDSVFFEMPVHVPSTIEQKKIGAFFSNLDNLISLQQRKLDQIKEYKKGMLQKMFPKEGESVPDVRFPGFTGEWELRKLEAICEVFTDGDWIEAKDQSDTGIRLVQTGNVGTAEYLDKPNNKKWISEETFDRLHCEEIYEGDILISRLPEPAGRACIMPDLGTRMITAVDCTIVRTLPNYYSCFLVQYLSTPMYFKVVNAFLGGGTRQRISRGNLSGIDIPLPHSFEEQQQIGTFFSNLDTLITLHQRKLEAMKEYKKGLLQQMIV